MIHQNYIKIVFVLLSFFLVSEFSLAQNSTPQLYWRQYVVVQGDTLEEISADVKNKTLPSQTVQEILRSILQYNRHISQKDRIYPNQMILIPAHHDAHMPARTFSQKQDVVPKEETNISVVQPAEMAVIADENKNKKTTHPKKWKIKTSGHLGYSKIKATDSLTNGQATFLSKANPGFSILLINQALSEYQWGVGFEKNYQRYSEPIGATLNNKTESLHHLYYQLQVPVSSRAKIHGLVGLQENAFISAVGAAQFSLDAIWQPYIGLGLEQSWNIVDKVYITPMVDALYQLSNFSDRYKVNASVAIMPAIELMYKSNFGALFVGAQYHYQKQDAQISEQTQQALELHAGFSVNL